MTGLFITSSRIGDAVMTLSIIEALRKQSPNMTYCVAADPLVASLFEDDPQCLRIIPFPKKKASLHWFHLWRHCIGTSWDWIVDTRGSAISYMLKTKKRFCWHADQQDRRPKIEQLCAMVNVPATPARIHINNDRQARLRHLLPEAPIFVVAPVANWIGKQWPIDRFREIIQRFCDTYKDAHIFVLAAPSEADQLDPLRDLPKDRVTFSTDITATHQLNLLDMAALIARGKLFLGNDSGLMHMSYALDVPVVGLFGPSRDTIYGPYPRAQHTVIRIPLSYDELVQTPGFSHKSHECYMIALNVDDVWSSIKMAYDKIRMETPIIESTLT